VLLTIVPFPMMGNGVHLRGYLVVNNAVAAEVEVVAAAPDTAIVALREVANELAKSIGSVVVPG
jgi:hypothetical protein